MILEYLSKFHFQDCMNILSETDNLGYYSIKIDFLKLFETYPDVGDKVLCSPIETLPICDKDIIKVQQNILEDIEYKENLLRLKYCYLKRNVHARFFGLPVCPELHRIIFPKNVDLGCFLKVTGTVVRVTQSKMLEYQRKYICMKCKYKNCVEAEFENRYILKAPARCGNLELRCKCTTFSQVHMVSREYCKDYQEIKIQEQVNKVSIGTIPGAMWVVLEDDLVDCCKPGDDVLICATVRRRWRPSIQSKKSEVELVLQANYIEVCNAQRSEVISAAPDVKECYNEFWSKYEACPLKGRDQILNSVCPQVYGLLLVKLAVLLTVITGANHVEEIDKTSPDDQHSTRVRGQCHLLLVGDPGTGKSQLLRAGAELTSRSVFTSGAGSTRAGLTCAALREEGEWQLEAGALVLSDGGVCCIDEISQLREHDRTAIHEAMEQQTISIAKAGIVCKLNTRCAIIAACNPKGHYDTDQPLGVNVSLGTPLLSRFDLIFILIDSKNKHWDKLVSSYILFGDSNPNESKKAWNLEKLQMYISFVGPKSTKMTKSANTILQSYYMVQRKSEHRDPSRTTVRMLDSLVRLSQAHCRLMYRDTILPMDAITAVSLIDLSMQQQIHSTFHKYPDFQYLCTAKKLLTQLNLLDIWNEELLYYGQLLQVDHMTLEHDINKDINRLFAKYDDVSDDNIVLSASLVTSSYFNNKKDQNGNKDKSNEDEKICVNDKLAKTLKKHSALNKGDKNPPPLQRNHKKRKRKEVTINSSNVTNKIIKRPKKDKSNASECLSESDDDFDNRSMLKAVPSVNDVFAELGFDFKFDCTTNVNSPHNQDANIKKENTSDNEIPTEKVKEKQGSSEITAICRPQIDILLNDIETSNPSKTNCKLKQFQFIEKHDLSKYEEKVTTENKKFTSDIVKLKDRSDTSSSIGNQKPTQNSQISIFESSDCDIDLDI